MSGPEPTIQRINVDAEAEWLKIRGNIERAMMETMEARLGTMPGGATGSAARAVRREVEARLGRVSRLTLVRDRKIPRMWLAVVEDLMGIKRSQEGAITSLGMTPDLLIANSAVVIHHRARLWLII